jgi:GT2 family glycosyltransferase
VGAAGAGLNGTLSAGSARQSQQREPALVSVVVPTFRRVERLQSLLMRLEVVDFALQLDVVIVDQTPQTDLAALARFSRAFAGLRFIHLDAANVAKARNTGARHAKAPVLLFIDDDMELEVSFIPCLLGLMRATPQVAFGAMLTVGSVAPQGRDTVLEAPPAEPRDFLPTGVMAVRREHFFKIGGFDERLFRYFEDAEFSHRLKQAGVALIRHRDLRAIHHDRRENGTWYASSLGEAASALMRHTAYLGRKTGRSWANICCNLALLVATEARRPAYLKRGTVLTRAIMMGLHAPAALLYAGRPPVLCWEQVPSSHEVMA